MMMTRSYEEPCGADVPLRGVQATRELGYVGAFPS